MSVPTKPTESLDWAESGTPPSAPGSTLPTEPSSGRKNTGYGFEEPLPHSEFNWLMRTLNRWLNWVTEKMDLHVHDGGTNPESVSKVHLKDHINYGTNGFFEVVTDNNSEHIVEHKGVSGSVPIFRSEALLADYFFNRNIANPMEIWGNALVRQSDGISSGFVTSRTTPKAMAKIVGSSRVSLQPLDYDFNYGFDITEAQGSSAGVYALRLNVAVPSQAEALLVVNPTNNLAGAVCARVGFTGAGLTQIQVRMLDTSFGTVDNDFVIAVYYI
jgi:hypothetical protein